MFRLFYPDHYVDSSYIIDYEQLYQKGYRGILFDIDNTLVEHGADANEKVYKLFQRLKNIGFQICLMSNNKMKRVERFNHRLGVDYIYKAKKPSRKSYIEAMRRIGTNKKNTLFVGDQLFTDVWGAKRIGITNYLVKPIDPKEEIQIVIKRFFEKIVLHFYQKEQKNKAIVKRGRTKDRRRQHEK